jgi:EAL domain-containing protein (putative c-di-GMP-specific phosphodiesterase class I)
MSEPLLRALEEHQFFVVYQPEIDLHSSAFTGVEALLRWRHPERGVLGPEAFLTELESSGLIVQVGRWILNAACRQGTSWHDKGYRFSVSVNVSLSQLRDVRFVDDVDDVLSDSRFDPASLVLEFSQRTLTGSDDRSQAALSQLKQEGVRIAIDDFSPGQSSLAELEDLPLDIVKLDRRFIAGMTDSTQALVFVHSIVQLARNLNLQIVASGIEDANQRRRLQDEDVAIGQGFHFSEPREADEISRYLEDFAIFSGKPL